MKPDWWPAWWCRMPCCWPFCSLIPLSPASWTRTSQWPESPSPPPSRRSSVPLPSSQRRPAPARTLFGWVPTWSSTPFWRPCCRVVPTLRAPLTPLPLVSGTAHPARGRSPAVGDPTVSGPAVLWVLRVRVVQGPRVLRGPAWSPRVWYGVPCCPPCYRRTQFPKPPWQPRKRLGRLRGSRGRASPAWWRRAWCGRCWSVCWRPGVGVALVPAGTWPLRWPGLCCAGH
mmetsp:Transcript_86480/g.197304  ORF Transcript_86480/g.197304 Transcript_86480/m.197304 type:complete len:228 (+) Transcript_86480:638-1321(+)